MTTSSNHHYLPEFYLKGFVNERGQFSIFDYNKSSIKKGEYFPSTHFFEKHRNSVETVEGKNDFPEKYYAAKDERYSKLFKIIQSSKSAPDLTDEQLLTLQDFASNLFWRIPKNDDLYEKEFYNNPLITKVWVIKDRTTGEIVNDDVTKQIKSSEAFKKSVRTTASDFMFMAHNAEDLHNWRVTYSHTCYHLCPDNPLILRDINAKNVFQTEFILPLTQNHLLIRTFRNITKTSLQAVFNLWVDTVLFRQGTLYCACSRKDFLNAIHLMSTQIDDKVLRKKIFETLE